MEVMDLHDAYRKDALALSECSRLNQTFPWNLSGDDETASSQPQCRSNVTQAISTEAQLKTTSSRPKRQP